MTTFKGKIVYFFAAFVCVSSCATVQATFFKLDSIYTDAGANSGILSVPPQSQFPSNVANDPTDDKKTTVDLSDFTISHEISTTKDQLATLRAEFERCVKAKEYHRVQEILQLMDPNLPFEDGTPPMVYVTSCETQDWNMARVLSDAGAIVDNKDEITKSYIKTLGKVPPPLNIPTPPDEIHSQEILDFREKLKLAAYGDVKAWLEMPGHHPNFCFPNDGTPEAGSTPLAQAILRENPDGSKGHLDMCKLLVEHKADLSFPSQGVHTLGFPLFIAIQGNNPQIIRYLMDAGMKISYHHASLPLIALMVARLSYDSLKDLEILFKNLLLRSHASMRDLLVNWYKQETPKVDDRVINFINPQTKDHPGPVLALPRGP